MSWAARPRLLIVSLSTLTRMAPGLPGAPEPETGAAPRAGLRNEDALRREQRVRLGCRESVGTAVEDLDRPELPVRPPVLDDGARVDRVRGGRQGARRADARVGCRG